MTVNEFFRAYAGEYNCIRIREYIGSANTIGADPEEDYKETAFSRAKDIPVGTLTRKVEYFDIESGTVTLWLED